MLPKRTASRIIGFAARLDLGASPARPSRAKLAAMTPGMIVLERQRNSDGEFAPQTATGADPGAMTKAYGPGASFLGGGKTAAVAAGLGTAAAAALLARRLRAPKLRLA